MEKNERATGKWFYGHAVRAVCLAKLRSIRGLAYRRDYRGRNFCVKVINWCRHGSYYSAIAHQQW